MSYWVSVHDLATKRTISEIMGLLSCIVACKAEMFTSFCALHPPQG